MNQKFLHNYLKPVVRLFFVTFLLLQVTDASAQRQMGRVQGTVQTIDGEPLAYASVLLQDTRYGTMAGNDGKFSFQAAPGRYTLIVTYAGYITNTKSIIVEPDKPLDVGTIRIEAAANQLREVVVADIQTNKFAQKQSSTPARMPLADLENAQVYSVVTKEIMQEQLAFDYNSAVMSVPGVVATNGVNDSGNDLTLRGFRSQATFRNGLLINPRTQTDIFNLERIEVLKGPSGTLFGGSLATYGGVANYVTKRPFESFRGEVNYTTGSWGLNRFTADINTPLNKDRTALIRINAVGHTQNSFQDAGYNRGAGLAASMLFKTTERTNVRFDVDYYASSKNLNAYIRNTQVLTVNSFDELDPSYYERSLTSDDIGVPRSTINALAEVEHRINDQWTSKTSYQHGESGEKGSIFFVPYFVNTEATIAANGANNTIQRRFRMFENYQLTTDNIQQNFIGDFRIANLRNRLVVGLDFFSNASKDQELYTGADEASASVFSVYDLVVLNKDAVWPSISKSEIQKRITNSPFSSHVNTISKYFTFGAYAADVLNVTDWLLLNASLRVDRYENRASRTGGVSGEGGYVQVQYSPKFGIVLQPIKDQVSIFANYSNGFTNVAPSRNTAGEMVIWDPQQAFQKEAGVKLDLFGGRLSSTLSYYDIKVSKMVRSLPDGTSEQDGDLDSKGLEAEVIASPIKGLNLIAGYGYNDNKYIKAAAALEGTRYPWSPKNVLNVWASYKIQAGPVKGIGLGAGVNSVSQTFVDTENRVTIPAYSTVGATLFFDQPKYRVGLKVNNLTNEKYWNFYGISQNPLQVVGNISYKF